MQRWHARTTPGFVLDPQALPLRQARKREVLLQATLATQPGRLQTLEGEVQVRPGDALVTGLAGERWRVSAAHFAAKYRPTGNPGQFVSLPAQVRVLPLAEPCEVLLADGESVLHGRPGDWLVDYGDGSLGIVAAHLFDLTYELL